MAMFGQTDSSLPTLRRGSRGSARRAPALAAALAQARHPDLVESVAQVGRWWQDPRSQQLVLSIMAAQLLDARPGWHPDTERCFALVMADDVLLLVAALQTPATVGAGIDLEFRTLHPQRGLRWLRLRSLPHSAEPVQGQARVHAGILVDITATKHAALRERFSLESAQYLVGSHPLSEAIGKIIQLVCENLGWDWGAYWTQASPGAVETEFSRASHWHRPGASLALFAAENGAGKLHVGLGLIGRVWRSGQAEWVERPAHDGDLPHRSSAAACGLRSGYVFPVSYVAANGQRHSPGVLEFFSCLPRQPDAQLPNLSAAIGSLIAQAALRHEQQAFIQHLAQRDPLTDLVNRSHFYQALEQACEHAAHDQQPFGVLFIDLDHFKPVNDVLGHEAGNQVLVAFAQRLRSLLPPGDCVGRLGGDEFAILSTRCAGRMELTALAQQVLQAAKTPFDYDGQPCLLSASIGISLFPEHGLTGPELMRSADSAMYRSKHTGRDALHIFVPDSQAQAQQARHLSLEAELHRALRDNEFFLEYQPVFNSLEDRLVAIEALIRWRRSDGEVVGPDAFIPVAAKSRLILQMGRWVMAKACEDLSRLHRAGQDQLQVHINLTMPDFANTLLPDELVAIVKASGIAPRHLCLEITEGLVMKDPDKVTAVMLALRKQGFGLSLDDFGMGHSSLSWLRQLPITSLKIDRSFIAGLPGQAGDGAIVRTVLDLGRHMKLKVIAEGVENEAQLLWLQQFGCHFVQGYLLGRPQALEAFLPP